MKQTNLSVFIPHVGCPHDCFFCDQRSITSQTTAPTQKEIHTLLYEQQAVLEQRETVAEIAFFGGSFTAIPRSYMTGLLETAAYFCETFPKQYNGIRISTRPDAIDSKVLSLLKAYRVTSIELGAQSMDDTVLRENGRGHTAKDVKNASRLIHEYGFSLGLQMMTGLYKDTPNTSRNTAKELIALAPDTVRIYPTVILKNTRLCALYEAKEYTSFDLETTVSLCAELCTMFEQAGIQVLRVGLHADATLEKNIIGGCYHPALGELIQSRRMYDFLLKTMAQQGQGEYLILAPKEKISQIHGHKKQNTKKLAQEGYFYSIQPHVGDIQIIKKEGKVFAF